jgi:ABC-type polysaccharide/polyol phosphate transport system ATPase subunit
MYARLSFAVAVSVNPDVLLLDELLAVGDAAFTAKCLERIRRFKDAGKTTVLVTHQPDMLLQWCDIALWMERGRVRMFGGAGDVAHAYHNDLTETPNDLSLVL